MLAELPPPGLRRIPDRENISQQSRGREQRRPILSQNRERERERARAREREQYSGNEERKYKEKTM